MVRTWILAAIGCAGACLPHAVQARALQETTVGAWKVVAYSDDKTGAFAYCGSLTQSRNGAGLMFSVDPNQHWSVGFSGPLGQLEAGGTYDVRYQVDRGQVHAVQAKAVQPTLLQIGLPQAGDLQEFRLGSEVGARIGETRVSFPLRDTPRMLAELGTCLQKGRALAAASGGSAPSGVPEAAQAAGQPSDSGRLEAVTLAANLLSRAQVTGFEMQPSMDVPARFGGQEVVWRAQGIAGAIRIQQDGATTPEKVRAGLVSTDVLGCEAHFAAEAVPGADNFGTSLFTQCDGDKGWSASYMTVARPQGGFYVLSLLGKPDKADALRQAAAALRSAAPDLVRSASTSTAPNATVTAQGEPR
jgi:hypothetical protein